MGYRIALCPGLLLGANVLIGDMVLQELAETRRHPSSGKGSVGDFFARFGGAEWDVVRERFRHLRFARTARSEPLHPLRQVVGPPRGQGTGRRRVVAAAVSTATSSADLSGPPAMTELERRGLTVRDPDLVFATPDHLVSTDPDRTIASNPFGGAMWAALAEVGTPAGIRLLELKSGTQGIVHVTAPEQGIVLPGHTVICGDSHTCTNGALGALAFGVGTSQSTQALASQVLAQRKPHQMRIRLDGRLGREVTAKDVALSLIGRLGASAGSGFAVEYAGPVVEAMDMEARLTLCNLTVELGAKFGVIAPDAVTVAWLKGRSFVPTGAQWDRAVADWRGLVTDAGAAFSRDEYVDCSTIAPMVTWGTSPRACCPRSTGRCPTRPTRDDEQRSSWTEALGYMGLRPGQRLVGIPIDWAFMGSCAGTQAVRPPCHSERRDQAYRSSRGDRMGGARVGGGPGRGRG